MTDWTVDTLKELMDQRFSDQEKAVTAALAAAERAVEAALAAAEKAVAKAEQAAEKRFEAMNEFRGQLSDQANTFLPRAEYDVQHAALDEKLNLSVKTLSDRVEQNALNFSNAVGSLNLSRASGEGKTTVRGEIWGYIVGAAGLVAIVVGVLLRLTGH